MKKIISAGCLFTVLLLTGGCSTSNHGTYVASTYAPPSEMERGQLLGEVEGVSSQTYFLYLFPVGDAPSTSEAVSVARSKFPDTRFLADVSIDDRVYWGIGFSRQIIQVKGTAYR
jgi:hypothetical protein